MYCKVMETQLITLFFYRYHHVSSQHGLMLSHVSQHGLMLSLISNSLLVAVSLIIRYIAYKSLVVKLRMVDDVLLWDVISEMSSCLFCILE